MNTDNVEVSIWGNIGCGKSPGILELMKVKPRADWVVYLPIMVGDVKDIKIIGRYTEQLEGLMVEQANPGSRMFNYAHPKTCEHVSDWLVSIGYNEQGICDVFNREHEKLLVDIRQHEAMLVGKKEILAALTKEAEEKEHQLKGLR